MARGLDHIVHAVRDLDAAGKLYERLGFTVGARNRHPWGTHIRIVQFPGFFIELLTFAEPEKLGADVFSRLFAVYNRDFAAAHEGLSMLILQSADAAANAQAFDRARIAASPVVHFEREGKRPDGSAVKVGFSLAFAEDGRAPSIHFATCQQHYPENFWNPDFQRHANGATGIAAAIIAAEDPEAHRGMLLAFTGAEEARAAAGGYSIPLPRGRIDVMTPAGFRARFAVLPPEPNGGARLAAMEFETRDTARLLASLEQGQIPYRQRERTIVVGPKNALGATLLFSPAG